MDQFIVHSGIPTVTSERDLKRTLNHMVTYIEFSGDIIICSTRLHNYCNTVEDGQERSLQFLSAGGLNIVATAMAIHGGNADLQGCCCMLISTALTFVNGWENVSKTGISEAVIAAMERFPNHIDVQEYGCLALACITFDLEEVIPACTNGSATAVLRALSKSPYENNIQMYGMLFISNLSFDLSSQSLMYALGIPDVVHQCLRRHMYSEIVLEGATSALANITFMNTGSQIGLLKQGAVDTILQIMDASGSETIVGYCARSLSFMYSTEDALDKYFRPDVIEAYKTLEERFPSLVKIRHSRLSVERVADPVVVECVEKGVCVNSRFPLCSAECKSATGSYCPTCCVQQKSFVCTQCDGEFSDITYCESCWNRYHKGHKGKSYFYASRCRNVSN